ncbi:MAG TPA: hypothetical protein DCL66_09390 [Gammaproteobacteria bacterium]|nr:hypothetical protein [Gammaproteobacteria bacterium]
MKAVSASLFSLTVVYRSVVPVKILKPDHRAQFLYVGSIFSEQDLNCSATSYSVMGSLHSRSLSRIDLSSSETELAQLEPAKP